MRLISCYIENFGKLSKFTYNFKEGINIIEEENGWGKSTFAAFIKSMFYGLEYRRGKIVTDRRTYMPWNGNKFGGYIIFIKDGTQYKIERFFGKTEKSDTLTVYDMSKNIITDDLGVNPGEEIWKVDRDSYEKTAFITLNDSSLLNDIISSKLGNIDDKEADLEMSSQGIQLLDNEMVKIRAKRGKGGLLDQKIEKVGQLRQDLKRYNSSLGIILEKENLINDEEEALEKMDTQMTEIEKEESNFILYEKKQQYLSIKSDYEKRTNEHNENKSFFKEKSLSEEELHIIKDEANRYISRKDQEDRNRLTEIEKSELKELSYKFRNSLPELFEIEECNEKIRTLSNQQTQLKSYTISRDDKTRLSILDNKYGNINLYSDIIDNYLNDFNRVAELSREENNINAEIASLDRMNESKTKKENKYKPKASLIIGVAIFIVGILFSLVSLITGGIVAIVGLVISILSIISNKKDKEEKDLPQDNKSKEKAMARLRDIKEEKNKLESGYLSFLNIIDEQNGNIASSLANAKVEINDYSRLKMQNLQNEKNIHEISDGISKLKEQIELFLGRYSNASLINDYERTLSVLRKDWSRFVKLSETSKSYGIDKKDVEESKEVLTLKLEPYYKDFPSNVMSTINELTKKYYAMETSNSNLEESKAKKDKFELENNIRELDNLTLPEKKNNQLSEDLRHEKQNLGKNKDEIIKKIERYKKDINILSQEADGIEDTESIITQLDLDIQDLQKEYDLISLTKECMIDAKENLATKYMGSMASMFDKYLKKLDSEETDLYQVDINLDVKVEHEGELYDSSQLSRGMKDLVQLSMRMALVETIYKDAKKPVLVLDDPFANLDNIRIRKSMELLKKTSSEYQIVYFTCHNSRNIDLI